MRSYAPSMGTRPLLAFIAMIAVLFASALTGTATASAATMNHDMQMMEMGHCSSPPASEHDGNSMPKQCCVAMCMATVAVAPSAPEELPLVKQPAMTFALPQSHEGYLGEIATPPPRLA